MIPVSRSVVHWTLRAAVSAVVLTYISYDVDHADLRAALSAVHVRDLLLPLGLFLAGQVLSALKWWLVGSSVGLRRPVVEYVRFYFIGMVVNVFGVSTIGGDVVRALYLGGGRNAAVALNSVVFDRVSGLAILMALGALALLAFPEYRLPSALSVALMAGGVALAVGWWTCPRLVRLLPVRNRFRRLVECDLAPFWRDRRLLVQISALSAIFHLSQVGVQYLLARAAGTSLPFSYCLVMHPVLSLMLAMPISIGGFGVREGGYLYFLTRVDVDDSIAVTMGLLWWLMTAVSGAIGGLIFVASGARLPRVRSRAAERVRGAV
jgi:glycosyltransferase 2 family protein